MSTVEERKKYFLSLSIEELCTKVMLAEDRVVELQAHINSLTDKLSERDARIDLENMERQQRIAIRDELEQEIKEQSDKIRILQDNNNDLKRIITLLTNFIGSDAYEEGHIDKLLEGEYVTLDDVKELAKREGWYV